MMSYEMNFEDQSECSLFMTFQIKSWFLVMLLLTIATRGVICPPTSLVPQLQMKD